MRVILETDRLRLRRFTPADLDALVELDNDPAVMRYLNGGVPVEPSEVAEALDWWIGHYDRADAHGFWAAIDRAGGDFLGWFHFRPRHLERPLEPELGYRLHTRAWGRGLATEGSRALIDRGFERFGVERVVAETMVVHVASRRVMEKSGMRPVRTFHADWPVRIDGDEHGDVEYAIDRAEWLAARDATAATGGGTDAGDGDGRRGGAPPETAA